MKRTSTWLIRKRKEYNLSQSQLQKLIGTLSLKMIQGIEQNRRKGSSRTWSKIERVFRNIPTTIPLENHIIKGSKQAYIRMLLYARSKGCTSNEIISFLELVKDKYLQVRDMKHTDIFQAINNEILTTDFLEPYFMMYLKHKKTPTA